RLHRRRGHRGTGRRRSGGRGFRRGCVRTSAEIVREQPLPQDQGARHFKYAGQGLTRLLRAFIRFPATGLQNFSIVQRVFGAACSGGTVESCGNADRAGFSSHRCGLCTQTARNDIEAVMSHPGDMHMSTITTKDGTTIYYKDWGTGPVVTFSHGWPLSADAWDGQMLFLAQRGFRVVAHDRRGHGRSSQASSGNDMDGYADDLAAVIEALDLRDITMVGHSTGGGEVARYIGRHGTTRVSKAVLIAAVPPGLVKSASNPEGVPIEEFDKLRTGLVNDRAQFYKEFALPFFGANRPGA